MTTDSNWLKSITESYRQEVSESARNLQEEAENLYNLVETIQTALQVDLTEEQVDALINMFESDSPRKEASRAAKKEKNIIDVASDHAAKLSDHITTGPGLDDSGYWDKVLRDHSAEHGQITSHKHAARVITDHLLDLHSDGELYDEDDVPTIPGTRDYPAEDGDPKPEADERIRDEMKSFKGELHKKLGITGKKK